VTDFTFPDAMEIISLFASMGANCNYKGRTIRKSDRGRIEVLNILSC
jgi:hypothetical protein